MLPVFLASYYFSACDFSIGNTVNVLQVAKTKSSKDGQEVTLLKAGARSLSIRSGRDGKQKITPVETKVLIAEGLIHLFVRPDSAGLVPEKAKITAAQKQKALFKSLNKDDLARVVQN